jgi:DNA polymerase-3 subunit alpha
VSRFVHLHNHSHYSLLDGACRIEDLVDRADKFGMPAIALTDHGAMHGAISFYKRCGKAGIKPLVGSEVYVAPGSRFEKQADPGTSGTAFHLVLLCKDLTGYKNLMKLVSAGYLEGFYYKPRIDRTLLRQHHEGLIALSACLKGEVSQRLLRESEQRSRDTIAEYRDIFGDDYYLEVQNHGIPEEETARAAIFAIARDLNIRVVATNDIHYLKKEHAEAHDILLCLQTGKDFEDTTRMRYNTRELYFKSEEEMAAAFPDHPEVLLNTLEVADKCDLHLDSKTFHLPVFQLPPEHAGENLDEFLAKESWAGLRERYATITPELEQRLQYELDMIRQMGYAGYFLITADFIRYARSQGIPVGPGRGSAAGSLVAYVLKITSLDPLRYGLIFERFLNPERISMPDIDIDFCYERREEVIRYVKEKYGYNNVCQIITFGTMAARAVIRDVGRVLKMNYSEVDRIAKLVPEQLKIKLEEALKSVAELRQVSERDETSRRLIEHALVLEGLARHASTHAAGVVITPEELTNYVPLYKTKEGDVTTQYDMKSLEDVGLLKMDFLGLRTLTVIQKTVDAVRARGISLDIDTIPLDDPGVYEVFARGETIGLFQFESSGMQEYLKKLKPTCLEDLIAMNALYRPGPMDYIDDFIRGKRNPATISYLHTLLKPLIEETYGIAVYQEQVIKMAVDVGGFSLGNADLLRRAMGKKDEKIMAEERIHFVEGASQRGVEGKQANEIYDMMAKFAGYGFNKSHAACYSLIAYQTGFLKVYYPAEFMAANLSSEMSTTARVVVLLEECRRMGLEVLPPDVNESFADFVVTDGRIRFGLGAVKNVGRGAIEAIVAGRQKHGRFATLVDLACAIDLQAVNKKVYESLIQAGAMDSLEGTRAQKFASIEEAILYAQRRNQSAATGQFSIFDSADGKEAGQDALRPGLPHTAEWSEGDALNREKTMLGFYLSGHPLDRFREDIGALASVPLADAGECRDNSKVRLCGLISEIKTLLDRQKRPMAFFKLEDFTGTVEGLTFADVYDKYRATIQVDGIVMALGKISTREGEAPKLIVEEVIPLEEARTRYTRSLVLAIDPQTVDEALLAELKQTFAEFTGTVPLYLRVRGGDANDYFLRSRSITVTPSLALLDRLRARVGRENVWVGA